MAQPVADDPNEARITVRLRNRSQDIPAKSLDFADANLYGVQVTCRVPAKTHMPMVLRELRDSFRYNRHLAAVGLNAHVTASGDSDTVVLQTETVPRESTFRLLPRALSASAPTFRALADDGMPILRDILEAMRTYDSSAWQEKITALSGTERAEAETARNTYNQEIAAFERGLTLLGDAEYPHVNRAFRLMNRTMSRVSVRYNEWRLFQIVFIVSQLPALTARFHSELRSESDESVEILWFAAGGGKTEAFLGLLLFACFLDRLEGKRWGVTAMLRFPLRLLTFQQMQRIARALAQAEIVRRDEELGGVPFSIGYFVGAGVTPNRIGDAEHTAWQTNRPPAKFQRLFACPFCDAPVELRYAAAIRQLQHHCTNQKCAAGGALPLYVVDSDIYRFLPTLVISTVDKLALLGQNQRFGNLFGRITSFCMEHGADFVGSNRGFCPAAAAHAGSDDADASTCGRAFEIGPFPHAAPALLIQDELHLLSEELGTFDAHYETAVTELVRSIGQRPWKIIAATATIEAFRHHAWNLYLRAARQFPGPGPEAYESFYYHSDRNRLGRVFIGIVGIGRKHTPSVTRALSLIYQELDHARDLASGNVGAANARYGISGLTRDDFR
ncbi:MAG: hypothetical protein JO051_01665, partial [Acidobacteriaceae bacterium]|nr:hypothetical protein [Acidobacteriaceae bacterium]